MTRRVSELQRLFPGHPGRHIRWTHTDPKGDKEVRDRWGAATQKHYARHLEVLTADGPGALGLVPGQKHGRQWMTPWAVLDFDDFSAEALAAFRTVLDRWQLQYLINEGTTGRGVHLWFLLDAPLPMRTAWLSLQFLSQVAQYLGVEGLDLRPSQAAGRSSGILLPYRGGAEDGLGINPLCLPTGEPVALDDLNAVPRLSADVFAQLGKRRSVQKFIDGQTPRRRPERLPRLESTQSGERGISRWEEELRRITPLWVKGRRHNLTHALAAYALHLGIVPTQMKADLLTVATGAADDELDARERIVEHCIERNAAGETLAYMPFYERAGIAPPAGVGEVIQERLHSLLVHLMNHPWAGKSGKTDRSLLKTILAIAWRHGVVHVAGVEVSVAWSQLWQEANIGSEDTLSQSLARLEGMGLLRRGRQPDGARSGSLVLTWTNRSTLTTGGCPEEFFGFTTHFRNGRGRLGKRTEQIMDILFWHGPQTRISLAQHLASRPADLRKLLDQLVDEDLLEARVSDGCLHLPADLEERLSTRQQHDGTDRAWLSQKALYDVRQRRFRELLTRRRQVKDKDAPDS